MIPNTTCYFIKDSGIFGPYPTDILKELTELGVKVFVDLTFGEKEIPDLRPYKHLLSSSQIYVSFPIVDGRVPSCKEDVVKLVVFIIEALKDRKVYIHCKGGHGRSGVIIALIYRRLFGWPAEEALRITNYCHSQRISMKPKMRRLGSPQTNRQRIYVRDFKFQ